MPDKKTPFEQWWHVEGSSPPREGEDHSEHVRRMCEIAWSNGEYTEQHRKRGFNA